MATVHGIATVNPNEDSYEFTLEGVSRQWIAPVFEEKALILPDGQPDLDENGAPKTERVIVTSSRNETLEEAARRHFIESLELDELTSTLDRLSFSVEFTLRGTVECELDNYDIESFGLAEMSAEDIDTYVIQENLSEYISDAVLEETRQGLGWSVELDYDIDDFEAE